jgi:hypothetical protein
VILSEPPAALAPVLLVGLLPLGFGHLADRRNRIGPGSGSGAASFGLPILVPVWPR